jgi:short-subunit dehydrogenase
MALPGHSVELPRPVVWIVGASRGIGRELALQFAMIGCDICLSARSAVELRKLSREISDTGGHAEAFPCDIRDGKEVIRTVRTIERTHGRIDAVILNAGVTSFREFARTKERDVDDILRTNLLGPISCLKAVLPGMMKRKRGWIATILTTAAIKTYKGSSIYSGAKAGLHALLKVLREEVRPYDIRVVNILPGATETQMWSAGARRRHGHRMMRAASVAEVVADLFQSPGDVVPEEVILRPPLGDIE